MIFDKKIEIKHIFKKVLDDNNYGLPFSHFFYEKTKNIIKNSNLFDDQYFQIHVFLYPLKEGILMNKVISNGKLIKEIADIIAKDLKRLSEILSDSDIFNA